MVKCLMKTSNKGGPDSLAKLSNLITWLWWLWASFLIAVVVAAQAHQGFGWRNMFLILGALGVFFSLLLLPFFSLTANELPCASGVPAGPRRSAT